MSGGRGCGRWKGAVRLGAARGVARGVLRGRGARGEAPGARRCTLGAAPYGQVRLARAEAVCVARAEGVRVATGCMANSDGGGEQGERTRGREGEGEAARGRGGEGARRCGARGRASRVACIASSRWPMCSGHSAGLGVFCSEKTASASRTHAHGTGPTQRWSGLVRRSSPTRTSRSCHLVRARVRVRVRVAQRPPGATRGAVATVKRPGCSPVGPGRSLGPTSF